MKTDAVMCIAFTSSSPSRIPLSCKTVSICGVMLIKARRVGTFTHSSLRKLFMPDIMHLLSAWKQVQKRT
jgi:hypothetical protein